MSSLFKINNIDSIYNPENDNYDTLILFLENLNKFILYLGKIQSRIKPLREAVKLYIIDDIKATVGNAVEDAKSFISDKVKEKVSDSIKGGHYGNTSISKNGLYSTRYKKMIKYAKKGLKFIRLINIIPGSNIIFDSLIHVLAIIEISNNYDTEDKALTKYYIEIINEIDNLKLDFIDIKYINNSSNNDSNNGSNNGSNNSSNNDISSETNTNISSDNSIGKNDGFMLSKFNISFLRSNIEILKYIYSFYEKINIYIIPIIIYFIFCIKFKKNDSVITFIEYINMFIENDSIPEGYIMVLIHNNNYFDNDGNIQYNILFGSNTNSTTNINEIQRQNTSHSELYNNTVINLHESVVYLVGGKTKIINSRSKNKVINSKNKTKSKKKIINSKNKTKSKNKVINSKNKTKSKNKIINFKNITKSKNKIINSKNKNKSKNKVINFKNKTKSKNKVINYKNKTKKKVSNFKNKFGGSKDLELLVPHRDNYIIFTKLLNIKSIKYNSEIEIDSKFLNCINFYFNITNSNNIKNIKSIKEFYDKLMEYKNIDNFDFNRLINHMTFDLHNHKYINNIIDLIKKSQYDFLILHAKKISSYDIEIQNKGIKTKKTRSQKDLYNNKINGNIKKNNIIEITEDIYLLIQDIWIKTIINDINNNNIISSNISEDIKDKIKALESIIFIFMENISRKEKTLQQISILKNFDLPLYNLILPIINKFKTLKPSNKEIPNIYYLNPFVIKIILMFVYLLFRPDNNEFNDDNIHNHGIKSYINSIILKNKPYINFDQILEKRKQTLEPTQPLKPLLILENEMPITTSKLSNTKIIQSNSFIKHKGSLVIEPTKQSEQVSEI